MSKKSMFSKRWEKIGNANYTQPQSMFFIGEGDFFEVKDNVKSQIIEKIGVLSKAQDYVLNDALVRAYAKNGIFPAEAETWDKVPPKIDDVIKEIKLQLDKTQGNAPEGFVNYYPQTIPLYIDLISRLQKKCK